MEVEAGVESTVEGSENDCDDTGTSESGGVTSLSLSLSLLCIIE